MSVHNNGGVRLRAAMFDAKAKKHDQRQAVLQKNSKPTRVWKEVKEEGAEAPKRTISMGELLSNKKFSSLAKELDGAKKENKAPTIEEHKDEIAPTVAADDDDDFDVREDEAPAPGLFSRIGNSITGVFKREPKAEAAEANFVTIAPKHAEVMGQSAGKLPAYPEAPSVKAKIANRVLGTPTLPPPPADIAPPAEKEVRKGNKKAAATLNGIADQTDSDDKAIRQETAEKSVLTKKEAKKVSKQKQMEVATLMQYIEDHPGHYDIVKNEDGTYSIGK